VFIVLVHWQIRPECEGEFLDYWRRLAVVRDRSGLIGEYLSRVTPPELGDHPWVTWHLGAEAGADAVHFINVGLWAREQDFLAQIASDFGDDRPPAPFELRRRRRLKLTPEAWRLGVALLPPGDSAGVR
jgi:hypothetical protein